VDPLDGDKPYLILFQACRRSETFQTENAEQREQLHRRRKELEGDNVSTETTALKAQLPGVNPKEQVFNEIWKQKEAK
jgi:hypothetical protein